MTLCRRCIALKSVVRKRPFWFLWGGQVAFSKKKRKIQVDLSFFSEKNIMDRLNVIVRFVLSLGNMSNVLHRNKKTGLCREKKITRPKTSSCPV